MQPISKPSQEPVAIVGFAFQFPQGAVDEESLWDKLINQECTSTEFPKDRLNIDAFHNPDVKSEGTIRPKRAHFLRDDIRNFDAQFFGIPPAEAVSLDPQQRGLLETTYQALENAGIRRGDIAGTTTSVHVGSFCNDYMTYVLRDEQQIPTYNATGCSQTLLSNRISWAFDLRGTSLTIDTACSSGLVALDLACQEIWSGRSAVAICAASNIIFSPENLITLSNMNFLSPDGKCFSFDHRGNGYAKGDGFATLILKPLSKAIEDGDTIRSLIRSTGSNQDGHTAGGITQPSKMSQKQLIAETYKVAGLDLGETRLFEAHGTGTAVGDPIEAAAIGETFRRFRSDSDPLFVGAVKSNFGHLEGASGLLGVIKTVLAIEKGVIPPNTNFEKLNANIDDAFFHLRFPIEQVPWPETASGIRRASVNSFGYGGTNAHVVLDDARSYMHQRGLTGNHSVIAAPSSTSVSHHVHADPNETKEKTPRLLVFSAFDEGGIERQLSSHRKALGRLGYDILDDYAYALACRRDAQQWRSFCVLTPSSDSQDRPLTLSIQPRRAPLTDSTICFVFTGQGAQWHGMGQQLLACAVFRNSLVRSQRRLEQLGWTSSLISILADSNLAPLLDRAQYSQVATTCIQIALVDVFRWLQLSPSVVVGHSSGEIAAAYCAGHLDHTSAIRVSYYRGLLSSSLEDDASDNHSMAAVGLSVDDVRAEIAEFEAQQDGSLGSFTISCVNSPRSVTISGPMDALSKFIEYLATKRIFARLLKVKVGYHSPQMSRIASQYAALMGILRPDSTSRKTTMVSSVTGGIVAQHHVCHPDYWVQNMVSTVDFLAAVQCCCNEKRSRDMKNLNGSHAKQICVDVWLEIGPHSALQGPLKQILQNNEPQSPFVYTSALVRNVSALTSLLNAIGCLWVENLSLDMRRIIRLSCSAEHIFRIPPCLPAYSFNHSVVYWEESRANVDFRFREHPRHDLCGTRFGDLRSKAEAQWRFRIQTKSMPWILDHKIQGSVVYPAAGSIAMVIEATKQLLAGQRLTSLELKDVEFSAPIHVSSDHDTQVVLHLSSMKPSQATSAQYRFRAYSSTSGTDRETLVCSGSIRGDLSDGSLEFEKGQHLHQDLRSSFLEAKVKCTDTINGQQLYETMCSVGLEYGSAFQTLANISYQVEGSALGTSLPLPTEVSRSMSSHFTVHPSRLDGLFQLGFVAMAGANSIRPMVPTRIGRLHIPVDGFGHSDETRETAHCQAIRTTERNAYFSISVFDEATLALKAHVEDLELTALSGQSEDRKSLEDAPNVCFQVQWKPDLATMSTDEIIAYCQPQRHGLPNPGWIAPLHSLTLSYATLALQSMRIRKETCGSSTIASYMTDFAQWLSSQVDIYAMVDPRDLGDLIEALPFTPLIDAYVAIGQNLPAILSGDIDLDEILPQGLDKMKLIQQLDTEVGTSQDPLQTYFDCLTHKHPDLRFCEISTRFGTIARSVLDSHTHDVTARRCAEYTIADVDESLLESTRQQLRGSEHASFKTMNEDQELSAQGFSPESYDVITINVTGDYSLHNQSFIDSVLALLKPDGKLIVREAPKTNLLWGFLFHLTSNPMSLKLQAPNLSSFYSQTPFRQSQNSDITPHWDATIYEKKGNDDLVISTRSFILVVDYESPAQQAIATQVCKSMDILNSSNVLSLSEAAALPCKTCYDFIILVELDKPLLSNIHEEGFHTVKEMLRDAKSVVWVKKGDDIPEYALNEGLLRVSRHENEKTAVVSLSLEIDDRDSGRIANRILSVSKKIQQDLSISWDEYEPEYREQNGLICIPRVVEARGHDKHVFSSLEMPLVRQTIGNKKLRMGIGTLGVLDTLEFIHDDSARTNLAADQVEIEVRAIGVNFKDLMGLLGRAPAKDLGSEFAGVVTAVGHSVKHVKPQDRVVAAYFDAFRTYARVPGDAVHRIPDDVSFEAAASIPTVFRTAYFCLYNLARLQKNESILIHRASGGTGQAAIQLAQMIGATIYVTVGSESKKQLLIDHYGILESHILYSRDTSFGSAIKRLTDGRGVDVVLNSLSGELMETSWDCVAPFGRFIEIGLGDAYTRQQLPMFNFSKGVSFMSFNLGNFTNPEYFAMHLPLWRSVWDLVIERKIHPPYPLRTFPMEKIEDAFRLLNSGNSSGKIVTQMDNTSIVPIVAPYTPTFQFDPNATYIVTGGLGGIGLKIAQWFSNRGARNLILVSRSGLVRNVEAQEVVSALTAAGVRVECPAVDIADRDAVETYFTKCQRTMPPIKGCIQSAMVLRDATLANMTVDDWHQALAPKVKGTWNLHEFLPTMDFMILLSSIVGVGGNRGQANYAAGNTFEDEFARWRTTKHHAKTVSLDLGFVVDAGVMAENDAMQNYYIRRKVARPNRIAEIFALFDRICDPAIPITTAEESQIINGMKVPSETLSEGAEVPPELLLPLFRISRQIQVDGTSPLPGVSRQSFRSMLSSATSVEEAGVITSTELQAKIAQVLGLRVEEVELNRPLSQYAMDSLVALEIQSWIRREADAEIAIFELLGEATVESLGRVVVTNSKLIR